MATGVADFTIGEMSRRTHCKIETIRYYERIGLMPAPPRTHGGYRLYDTSHQKRLNFVRRGRELGFSLDRVRELLALAEGDGATCDEARETTLVHLADIEQKIADLGRMADVLREMAARCTGGNVPDCPILEALFDGS
jgi:MerR family mercuric resistance operon transcriptional regulator